MENNAVKRDNRKALPKFFLILLGAAVFGGVAGFAAGWMWALARSAERPGACTRAIGATGWTWRSSGWMRIRCASTDSASSFRHDKAPLRKPAACRLSGGAGLHDNPEYQL